MTVTPALTWAPWTIPATNPWVQPTGPSSPAGLGRGGGGGTHREAGEAFSAIAGGAIFTLGERPVLSLWEPRSMGTTWAQGWRF